MKSSPCLSCAYYHHASYQKGEDWNVCGLFKRNLKSLSTSCSSWQRAYGLIFQDMIEIHWKVESNKESGFK